jgi:hypothetical protein
MPRCSLAVAQVLLGVRSEARWLRFVPRALPAAFAPGCPRVNCFAERFFLR